MNQKKKKKGAPLRVKARGGEWHSSEYETTVESLVGNLLLLENVPMAIGILAGVLADAGLLSEEKLRDMLREGEEIYFEFLE